MLISKVFQLHVNHDSLSRMREVLKWKWFACTEKSEKCNLTTVNFIILTNF